MNLSANLPTVPLAGQLVLGAAQEIDMVAAAAFAEFTRKFSPAPGRSNPALTGEVVVSLRSWCGGARQIVTLFQVEVIVSDPQGFSTCEQVWIDLEGNLAGDSLDDALSDDDSWAEDDE